MNSKIKFRILTETELFTVFGRLRRFTPPIKKLERILQETLNRHYSEPTITLKNFRTFELSKLLYLFQVLWNNSVKNIYPESSESFELNLYLIYEELKAFSSEEFLKMLISSYKIGEYSPENSLQSGEFISEIHKIKEILVQNGLVNADFIENKGKGFTLAEKLHLSLKMAFPINISGCLKAHSNEEDKRLLYAANLAKKADLSLDDEDLKPKLEYIYHQMLNYREEKKVLNPVNLLILAEGITEEILLPVFGRVFGLDFYKKGIKIISSGGKNQVLRLYKNFKADIKIPILIILDADAAETGKMLTDILKTKDKIYILQAGEIEDTIPDNVILRAINSYYCIREEILPENLVNKNGKLKKLEQIWKEKGFGEFRKAEFAKILSGYIESSQDISEELERIFIILKELLEKNI